MVSLLLYILIRIYGKEKLVVWTDWMTKKICKRSHIFFVIQVVALMLTMSYLLAQEVNFKVLQNNNKIGWIQLRKTDSGASSTIELESEIKKRLIFLISVIERQQVLFNDGIMMKSYVYRKVNDNIKMNKHTVFAGNYYEVNNDNFSERISIQRIHYNQLSLYFKEPVNISQVYSDSYQQFLPIVKMGNSCYKVLMPDGNVNYYYYRNGACIRVKVEHSLFTVEFIRV